MGSSEVPGGEPQGSGGTDQDKNQDQKPKQDVVSHDTYKKVLDEKKAMQARLQAFEAKEKEELAKSGKFQELYEAEKAAREKLEKEAREERAVFAYTSVASQVKSEALKLGCMRPDALERLLDLDELSGKVGKNFVVDQDALKAFVEKAAKDHDYLFKKEAAGFRDAPPSKEKPEGKLTYEDWLKLPLDEKKKRYGEIREAEAKK